MKHEPVSHQGPDGIRFDVFEMELRSGELRKADVKLKLTGQTFQVLAILVEHAGEVATREDLRTKFWDNNTFVDFDPSLANSINKIRDVLGDSADSPRFIETLPKRGYRFIVPVSLVEAEKAVAPPARAEVPPLKNRRSFIRMAAGGAAAVAAGASVLAVGLNVGGAREGLRRKLASPSFESIAVLPLENVSGNAQQDDFADGMPDALITVLGYDTATVGAGRGDFDNAFEWLNKSDQERSSFMVHIKWDSRFRKLHSDSRFPALLQRSGLPA